MRTVGWMTVGGVCAGVLFSSGCASMDSYRRLQAQNRMLAAQKQALDQELFDARSAN